MKSLAKSVILSVAFVFVGCGGGGSSSSTTNPVVNNSPGVASGTVDTDTGGGTNNSARLRRAPGINTPNCGTSASVQLYAIDDTQYSTPFLTSPVDVNISNCEFEVQEEDFVDPTQAGSDKQYLIRTIVEEGAKKIELSTTKLKSGVDVGTVDPVATMVQERFKKAIKEAKESMEKLKDLGITQTIIDAAIDGIVSDFEENFDDTVKDLKEEVSSGKLVIEDDQFETEEALDEVVTEEMELAREEKAKKIEEKLLVSSVADTFTALDTTAKKSQLDNVVIDADTLRGNLSEAVAVIKYGVISSFAKLGLPVHNGKGKIIVFMPTDISKKGELPGKTYQLSYEDKNGTTQKFGDDFAIRLIDPSTDLSTVTGTEDWYKNHLQDAGPYVPESVINAMIEKKDSTITMEDLGKTIDKMVGGDGQTDKFVGDMYSVVMNGDIEGSVKKLIDVYGDTFIKTNFERFMFDEVEGLFAQNDNTNIVTNFLQMPFIVQGDETAEQFISRLGTTGDLDFIIDQVSGGLVSGIPLSDDDDSILQFKKDFEVSASTKLKPLSALAMVALYMEAFGGNDSALAKQDAKSMFGWMLDGTNQSALDNIQVWATSDNGNNNTQNAPAAGTQEDDKTIEERVSEDTEHIVLLAKAITGTTDINVEREFSTMMKELVSSFESIEKKNAEQFNFEDEFKGDLVDFGDEESIDAAVSFRLLNFNNQEVNETLIIAPIFTNIETNEWKTFIDLNNTLSQEDGFDNEQNSVKVYAASNIKVFNTSKLFDENGNESETGIYKPTEMFDVLVESDDGTFFPIASFPLFPGNNNLGNPIFYDDGVDYGFVDFGEDNATAGDPNDGFIERKYLTADGDVFFPQITKTDGEDVGEFILSYDISEKKFSAKLDNGVVSDASMNIVVLYQNYSDESGNFEKVDTIELSDDGINEGALISLELKGSQIKTQKVNMSVLYVGENGEVEIELYKDEEHESTDTSSGINQNLKNRFQAEKEFKFEKGAQKIAGSYEDLTFNDDGTVKFKDIDYEFLHEDFNSVSMKDENFNFVKFSFQKEEYTQALNISQSDISGKTVVVSDGQMEFSTTFNEDNSVGSTEKFLNGYDANNSRNTFLHGSTWSIENGAIKLSRSIIDNGATKTVNDFLIVTRDEGSENVFDVGDKIVLATEFDSTGEIKNASEQKVTAIRTKVDGENSDIVNNEGNQNNNDNNTTNQSSFRIEFFQEGLSLSDFENRVAGNPDLVKFKNLFATRYDGYRGLEVEKVYISDSSVDMSELKSDGTFEHDETEVITSLVDNIFTLDGEKVKFVEEINASEVNASIFSSNLSKAYEFLVLTTKDEYDLNEEFEALENNSTPTLDEFISHSSSHGIRVYERNYDVVLGSNGKVFKSFLNTTGTIGEEVGTWEKKTDVEIESNLTSSILQIELGAKDTHKAVTVVFTEKDSKAYRTYLIKEGSVESFYLFNEIALGDFKTFLESFSNTDGNNNNNNTENNSTGTDDNSTTSGENNNSNTNTEDQNSTDGTQNDNNTSSNSGDGNDFFEVKFFKEGLATSTFDESSLNSLDLVQFKDLFSIEFNSNSGLDVEKIHISSSSIDISDMEDNGTFVHDETEFITDINGSIISLDGEKIKFVKELNASDINDTIFTSATALSYKFLILTTRDDYDLDDEAFVIFENNTSSIPTLSTFIEHHSTHGLNIHRRGYHVILDENGSVFKTLENNMDASSEQVGSWSVGDNVDVNSTFNSSVLKIEFTGNNESPAHTEVFVEYESKVYRADFTKEGSVEEAYLFNNIGMNDFTSYAESLKNTSSDNNNSGDNNNSSQDNNRINFSKEGITLNDFDGASVGNIDLVIGTDIFGLEADSNDGIDIEKINISTSGVNIYQMENNGTFALDETESLTIDQNNIFILDTEKVKFVSERNATDVNGTIFKQASSKAYKLLILSTQDEYDLDEGHMQITENGVTTSPTLDEFIAHHKTRGFHESERNYHIILGNDGKVYKTLSDNSTASSEELGTWENRSSVEVNDSLTTSVLFIELDSTSTHSAKTLVFVEKDSKVYRTWYTKEGSVERVYLFNTNAMNEFKNFIQSL